MDEMDTHNRSFSWSLKINIKYCIFSTLQGPKLSIILIAIHFQFAFYYIRSILLEDLLIVIGALGSD